MLIFAESKEERTMTTDETDFNIGDFGNLDIPDLDLGNFDFMPGGSSDELEPCQSKEERTMTTDETDFNIGDFGNLDIPDLDLGNFDFMPGGSSDELEPCRYTKPRLTPVRSDQVLYKNAVDLARDLKLDFGQRIDCIVNGSFIFGDFIEAFVTTHNVKCKKMTISTLSFSQENIDSLKNLLDGNFVDELNIGDFIEAFVTTHNVKCKKMTISTLSFSQENIDSLKNLLDGNFVDELNIVTSVYFYNYEIRSLIPYAYRQLDRDNKFQLAVAGIHTKTTQFETLGGRKIVMHGSSNLRSSGSLEQFCIEENPQLYDFYDEKFGVILEKYATIKKAINHNKLWNEITKKKFND